MLAVAAGCEGDKPSSGRLPPPQVVNVPAQKALFVAGRKARVYHYCTCAYARDIPKGELVGFASAKDADRAGKIPCAVCRPNARGQEAPEAGTPSGGLPRAAAVDLP